MADYDIYNSPVPQRKGGFPVLALPTVAQLKAALTAFNATSYSAARLHAMTKQDMLNAVRVHGLTVNTSAS